MNSQKMAAIRDFPDPICVKDLQNFLGLINAYRKFSGQHASLISPLLHLLKKGVPWSWGDSEKEAFKAIKDKFIEVVILYFPNTAKRFFISTDASFCSVAAELFQFDDNEDRRPISFYSRTLSQSERNYGITELELLAIVVACSKFRQYIWSFPVTVQTDHQALAFLKDSILSTGRLTRWALYLQQFDLQVDYIKAKDNVIADVLSRYPPDLRSVPPFRQEININALKNVIPKDVLQRFSNLGNLQKSDSRFSQIYVKMQKKIPFQGDSFYLLFDNLLFVRSPKIEN